MIFFRKTVSIASNIQLLNSELPSGVALCAVSKFHPAASITDAYNTGQRIFGESRPQELVQKAVQLPPDIKWHFIGHLQTNKVAAIIPYVDLIHSVDSIKLLEFIGNQAVKAGVRVKVLLQVHIATEESKQGFTGVEIRDIMAHTAPLGTQIVGLMGMASLTDDGEQVEREFTALHSLYNEFKNFTVLSMGMSGDWKIAVKHGANIVRIGSAIFGNRNY